MRTLKIVIDEARRHQEVMEIVDSDIFAELQEKAREMRLQRRRKQAELAGGSDSLPTAAD